MADANSTSTHETHTNFAWKAVDFCGGISTAFDIIEREISAQRSTETLSIEYLMKGARAELDRFGDLACKTYEKSKQAPEAVEAHSEASSATHDLATRTRREVHSQRFVV